VTSMHFIGLDIHKKTISYCVKDVSGTLRSASFGSPQPTKHNGATRPVYGLARKQAIADFGVISSGNGSVFCEG
jgi:hypothetical protein